MKQILLMIWVLGSLYSASGALFLVAWRLRQAASDIDEFAFQVMPMASIAVLLLILAITFTIAFLDYL